MARHPQYPVGGVAGMWKPALYAHAHAFNHYLCVAQHAHQPCFHPNPQHPPQVPHRIVIDGIARAPTTPRIQHLAAMRNAALQPLLHTRLGNAAPPLPPHATVLMWDTARGPLVMQGNTPYIQPPATHAPSSTHAIAFPMQQQFPTNSPHQPPPPDLVFINDVFWCPWHVHRLRTVDRSAQLLCGVDVSGVDEALYDRWVSRGRDGRMLPRMPPYGAATPSQPFAVSCCWNGLAVFPHSRPFLGGGVGVEQLRFRAADGQHDCDASECSLLCDDMITLGMDRIAIDPHVLVAYALQTARRLASKVSTERHPPVHPVDWDTPVAPARMCCPVTSIDWAHVDDWCTMQPRRREGVL